MPDPTPAILESANRFRAQLLARERRSASAMVRYYGQTWRGLQADIHKLEQETAKMRAGGEVISQGRIWRLERMKAIQKQAASEANRFAQYADDTISAGQREAIVAGQRDAHQLILAGFPPDAVIEVSFATMPREAVESLVGFLADGSPLVDVLRKHVGDAAGAMGERLVAGLAAGWNPRRLARELRSTFGMGLTDALRIARTEQLRAYRTATLNSYQQNSDVVKEWERLATQDTRTCMACIMLDGKRYSLTEPMDDHVQGRCALLPITKTYAELGIDAPEPDFTREKTQDWFQRQPEVTQRQMMGNGMYEAWKAGKFRLEDIPKQVKSDVWGNAWVPKSLKELLAKPPRLGGAAENDLLAEIRETTAAYQEALKVGKMTEAEGIKIYLNGLQGSLDQEQQINEELWRSLHLNADEATDEDWQRVADKLNREGAALYRQYSKEGISFAVDEQRGAQSAGYAMVGGQWAEVKRGAFSVREGVRIKAQSWATAKDELSAAMGSLLEKAGFSKSDIAQASYEQRRRLLDEIGNMTLSRTGRQRISRIDKVPENSRAQVIDAVDHDLAATCASSSTDPLALPTIDAYSKLELADLIRSYKLGR